jgi:alpha-L-rhamnosidase
MRTTRAMLLTGLAVLAAGLTATTGRLKAEDNAALLAKGKWIWFDEGDPSQDAPAESRYFRRTFKLPADKDIKKATFLMTGDNHFELYLNGKKIGNGDDWQQAQCFDVKANLVKGDNLIAVIGTNDDGPAGLIGALKVELDGADPVYVGTDKDFKASKTKADGWEKAGFDEKGWIPVKVMGDYGMDPWGTQVNLP